VTDVVCTNTCSYVIAAGKCLIDGACFSAGATPPGDPCRTCDPATPLAWTFTNAECDDDDSCTSEDVCSAGICDGKDIECGDGLLCTLDFCDGGSCQHQVGGDGCLVAGRCYARAEPADDNACLGCVPEVSRLKLSARTNEVCDDGDACTPLSKCSAEGVCQGVREQRDPEPNDTLEDAVELGTFSAGAAFPAGTQQGTIWATDVDLYRWFMIYFETTFVYRPRVAVRLDAPTAVELCLYARCGEAVLDFEAPVVACDDDERESALDSATLGCCRSWAEGTSPTAELAAVCLPGASRGFAFARITAQANVDDTSCGGYELDWGAD
jgi:hypothetical protein